MRTFRIVSCLIALVLCSEFTLAQQLVEFRAKDSLLVTADLYRLNEQAPYIVLCHLAGHSRGEYLETAKRLNKLGFNCLAVDARSGREARGIENLTARRAKEAGLPTGYLDAEQDIIAAIDYALALNGGKGVMLLGSSYSASLALKIAAAHAGVKGVVAFSPNEYFGSALSLRKSIQNLDKPLFVSSSRKEATAVGNLIREVPSKVKRHFIPLGEGAHGSIALWEYSPDHAEYWTALTLFLQAYGFSKSSHVSSLQ